MKAIGYIANETDGIQGDVVGQSYGLAVISSPKNFNA